MGGGFLATMADIIAHIVTIEWLSLYITDTAPTAAQTWTVAMRPDFYFAVGSDPCDVFIVVNGNWIPYKRCDTEEAAQALVTGQNESRRDGNA